MTAQRVPWLSQDVYAVTVGGARRAALRWADGKPATVVTLAKAADLARHHLSRAGLDADVRASFADGMGFDPLLGRHVPVQGIRIDIRGVRWAQPLRAREAGPP